MSTEPDESGSVPDDLLAAEFVLGVLDPESWRVAEARRAADPAFSAIVSDWEQRLADLADAVPSVPPPARVHRRVEAELALLIARTPVPEPEPEPLPPPPGPSPDVRFWRRIAFAAGTLAAASVAALGVLLFVPLPGIQGLMPRSVDVATLGGENIDHVLFFVTVDRARREVLVTPVGALPADRVPQLWFVPEGGPPQSLGVFSANLPRVLPLPVLEAIAGGVLPRGAKLAVSLEPPGGSTVNAPSGPVVADGLLSPTL